MESPNPFSREAFLASAPPPKSSKTPHPSRSKRLTLGIIGAAILGVAAFFLVPYLIRAYTRNPYATMQNGLILRNTRLSYDANSGSQTASSKYPHIEVELPRGADFARATARASTGDTFSLNEVQSYWLPVGPFDLLLGDRRGAQVDLPHLGVPATYQWMDITVEDTKKHQATWRIFDLPRMEHTLLPTEPLHESEISNGISLHARAWWNDKATRSAASDTGGRFGFPYRDQINMQIKAVTPSAALSRPSQSWSVQIQDCTLEWTPAPERTYLEYGEMENTRGYIGRVQGPFSGPGICYAEVTSQDAPSAAAQHIARIHANLIQYDGVLETVTFHNVPIMLRDRVWEICPPAAISMTTPYGVRITLEKPNAYRAPSDTHKPTDVCISYDVAANSNFASVPLGINADHVESLRIETALTLDKAISNGVENHASTTVHRQGKIFRVTGANLAYLIGAEKLNGATLPKLTITVSYRTKRQTVPLTFTVPVRAGTPKENWAAN